eukprot:6213658-Pleurochrysis_carterae.AAC.1
MEGRDGSIQCLLNNMKRRIAAAGRDRIQKVTSTQARGGGGGLKPVNKQSGPEVIGVREWG